VRVGILEVVSVNPGSAKAKIIRLNPGINSVQKDDYVSPEPIPRRDNQVFNTPLLPGLKKGKLLFRDSMDVQYLSPGNNNSASYVNGKLNLDARNNTSWHADCIYPSSVLIPAAFILDLEAEFKGKSGSYNRINIIFREKSSRALDNGYALYLHDEGAYALCKYINGNFYYIQPLQVSPSIKRGNSKNTFMIYVKESRFDIYINGQFVTAFEDESIDRGTVGFTANPGAWVQFDEVKIWEAVE
jgi:hypothetical protein